MKMMKAMKKLKMITKINANSKITMIALGFSFIGVAGAGQIYSTKEIVIEPTLHLTGQLLSNYDNRDIAKIKIDDNKQLLSHDLKNCSVISSLQGDFAYSTIQLKDMSIQCQQGDDVYKATFKAITPLMRGTPAITLRTGTPVLALTEGLSIAFVVNEPIVFKDKSAIVEVNDDSTHTKTKLTHLDLPSFNSGDGTFDTLVGGFKFVDADTLTQFGNEVLRNEIKNNTPDIYAYMQDFEKAIVNPTIENVAEFKSKQQALESIAVLGLAQGIISTYDIAQKITLDQPLTAKEQTMVSQSNYPIMAVANELRKRVANQAKQTKLDDGIYKGITDNTCNYNGSCNEVINTANTLMAAQAFDGYNTVLKRSILQGSTPYAINLALLNKSPDSYQALQDTEMNAYQKAQLAMLTDIDQQLRKLNHKLN